MSAEATPRRVGCRRWLVSTVAAFFRRTNKVPAKKAKRLMETRPLRVDVKQTDAWGRPLKGVIGNVFFSFSLVWRQSPARRSVSGVRKCRCEWPAGCRCGRMSQDVESAAGFLGDILEGCRMGCDPHQDKRKLAHREWQGRVKMGEIAKV
jgi:hypothetical protein